MRITSLKRRSAAILAVAAVGAVAVAGIAMGSGATQNVSSLTGSEFRPTALPFNTFKNGTLFVHTRTNYGNPGNFNAGGAVERTRLYFDDDGKVNVNATPRCNPSQLAGNITMKTAMARCGSSKVSISPSKAQAIVPGPTDFVVNGCVLVFNGANDAAGRPTSLVFTRVQVASPPNNTINCSNPAQNENGNTSILLKGIVKPNPSDVPGTTADGDFTGGKMVDYDHITDAADIPLHDFQVTVNKGSYLQARCHDADKRLNIRGKFTYNDGTSDLAGASKACTIG